MTIARPALRAPRPGGRRRHAVADPRARSAAAAAGGRSLLRELRERLGRGALPVHRRRARRRRRRSASSGRSCLRRRSVAADVPLGDADAARGVRRDARVLRRGARAADGEPATFLLDEVLELRTFENFPGLRHVLRDLLDGARRRAATGSCSPRRYVARALRLLRDAAPRFEVIHMPPLRPAGTAPAPLQANADGDSTPADIGARRPGAHRRPRRPRARAAHGR